MVFLLTAAAAVFVGVMLAGSGKDYQLAAAASFSLAVVFLGLAFRKWIIEGVYEDELEDDFDSCD